jgi:hypothetical protein
MKSARASPIGGLRGVGVWTARAGAANANLRNGGSRVGLKAGVCLTGLAAMDGHARRVSRQVTVKIVFLRVPFKFLVRAQGQTRGLWTIMFFDQSICQHHQSHLIQTSRPFFSTCISKSFGQT